MSFGERPGFNKKSDLERKRIEFDGEDPTMIMVFEEIWEEKYYRVKTIFQR